MLSMIRRPNKKLCQHATEEVSLKEFFALAQKAISMWQYEDLYGKKPNTEDVKQ